MQSLIPSLYDFAVGLAVGLLLALFLAAAISLTSDSKKRRVDASEALLWAGLILLPLAGPIAWFRSRRGRKFRAAKTPDLSELPGAEHYATTERVPIPPRQQHDDPPARSEIRDYEPRAAGEYSFDDPRFTFKKPRTMATPIYENVTHDHAMPGTDGEVADVEVADVAVADVAVADVEVAEGTAAEPVEPVEPQRRRSSHRPVPWP